MPQIITKIISTPQKTISKTEIASEQAELIHVGKHVEKKIRSLFNGSLAIREVDAGSDNASEHELTALSNVFYDIERFGIHFVASPRHADMLMVTGPVARNMASALIAAYAATPNPKIVVAVGDDAIDGGIFKGSYATYDGVNEVIPVNYAIPGDPPTPLTMLRSLLAILGDLEGKK